MHGIHGFAGTASVLGIVVGLSGSGCNQVSPVESDPASELAVSAKGGAGAVVFPVTCCYYEDEIVRTVVPPARSPKPGIDNFYGFPSGAAEGQLGVVGVAPGDTDYHGGHWAFHAVTWNVTPYLLTSEDAVLAAAAAGDVTVTRDPAMDFKCPIQP